MTHSPEVRREAIERILAGETLSSVSQDLGVPLSSVHEWKQAARDTSVAISGATAVDIRKIALAEVATEATHDAVVKLRAVIDAVSADKATAEDARSIAYAAEKLSNIALDWTVGRRGFGGVTIAAGNVVSLPDGLTLDELRAIAAPGPDVSTPLIVNHE